MTLDGPAASKTLRALMQRAPVIPVLAVDDVRQAAPLAEALVAGGLPVIEVTLRTQAALDVVAAMRDVPGAVVGVGTVLSAADAEAAAGHDAAFAVSPGATEQLYEACEASGLPLLAGAVTASEMMAALDRGYDVAKFFPAEPAGGAAYLKALSAPMPQMAFCPTGGIDAGSAASYLALPNVLCVGGSWVVPRALLAEARWQDITRLARAAAALPRQAARPAD